MTEKDFEQLKPGDAVVYKGNSPLGEDFTRGKAYKVKDNNIGLGIIGFLDNQGVTLRYFRHKQAPNVFCSQEEWEEKWQYVCSEKDIHVTDAYKAIDWEERRYEIAKAAMVGQLAAPIVEGMDPNPSMAAVCKWSVMFADTLIEELKKSNSQT